MGEREKLFIELLKAGLWETEVDLGLFENSVADWEGMMTLAREQTVTGVFADGLAKLPKTVVPRVQKITITKEALDIEERNGKLNAFMPKLFALLEKEGTHPWLIKGQGVGQNYADPTKRIPGDIDVFFPDEEEYERMRALFLKHLPPEAIAADTPSTKNFEFYQQDIYVELHGQVLAEINRKSNRNFQTFLKQVKGMPERRWNGVPLPPPHFDAVFIFTHLVRHYFGGGIGLRQVCDWMRFLHRHGKELELTLLERHLDLLGLKKLWLVFGAIAVDFLGCPEGDMPFYQNRYRKQGERILAYILESGNFGYYDKRTKSSSSLYMVRRWKAFTGHLQMKFRNLTMFPEETVYGIPSFIIDGVRRT